MTRTWMAIWLSAVCCVALVLTVGCDDNDNGDEAVDLTGEWWFTHSDGFKGTLTLDQSGTNVTGTVSNDDGSAPVDGTFDGMTASLTLHAGGTDRMYLTGTLTGDVLSGTFVEVAKKKGTTYGTWGASRI